MSRIDRLNYMALQATSLRAQVESELEAVRKEREAIPEDLIDGNRRAHQLYGEIEELREAAEDLKRVGLGIDNAIELERQA